jgi:hypothetical protein
MTLTDYISGRPTLISDIAVTVPRHHSTFKRSSTALLRLSTNGLVVLATRSPSYTRAYYDDFFGWDDGVFSFVELSVTFLLLVEPKSLTLKVSANAKRAV